MRKPIVICIFMLFLTSPMVYGNSINVYDDNDQYLGIFVNMVLNNKIMIYIPVLDKFSIINNSGNLCDANEPTLFYEGTDCGGITYTDGFSEIFGNMTNQYIFSKISNSGPIIYEIIKSDKDISAKSMIQDIRSGCISCSLDLSVYEAVQIPDEKLPFSLPVALPFRFKFRSDYIPMPPIPKFGKVKSGISPRFNFPHFGGKFKITEVYDGDTVRAEGDEIEVKIRLIGIDAPEKSKKGKYRDQPFSHQAKNYLSKLVLNRTVDIIGYGLRPNDLILGLIRIGDRNINYEMVRAGYAEVDKNCRLKVVSMKLLIKEEEKAKKDRRGMWSQGDKYISPNEWGRRNIGKLN